MCLYIAGYRHKPDPNRISSYLPLVADRPLLVKKRVRRGSVPGTYFAPYRGDRIEFGVPLETTLDRHYTMVEKGFHCYLYSATRSDWEVRSSLDSYDVTTIFCVIPVGAEYYIGTDREVVTNKIMYFETHKDVADYYGISLAELQDTAPYRATHD